MKHDTQHIILVSIDTLRADCISASPRAKAYEEKYHTTVHLKTEQLDRIARSGIYYNNCFSAAPYTSASHAAYFTGMWPLRNGIYEFFNRTLLKLTVFTYAKNQGYTTIFQTDFPVILGHPLGFTNNIDHYYVEDEQKAFKTLVRNRKNRTLSFFHFGGVHYPYGFHILKFGGKDYVNKIRSLEKKYGIVHKNKQQPDDILTETYRNKQDSELLLRYKYIIEKLYGNGLYDDLFQLYLEGINYFLLHRFNTFIRKTTDFVDSENAILFLFSDHGEEWDKYSEGHHNTLSKNVLRVPLMVYGKHIHPHVEERLIRTIDVAPTIMNLFPQTISSTGMDGSPLEIFSSSRKISSSHYAISQVWTSIATKQKLASYQKASIKNSRVKPLKTYLSGETIRTKDKKYVVYYRKNGSISRKESHGSVTTLKGILVRYNAIRKRGGRALTQIELKIRNELNNMGYRV